MNTRFILLSALLGGASLLTSNGAGAQVTSPGPSVTGMTAPPTRLEPDGTTNADGPSANPHLDGVLVNVIDLGDCTADLEFSFPLTFSSPITAGYQLNAWVGPQDCTPLENRSGATAVCWPAAAPLAVVVGSTGTAAVRIRMRDIASQAFTTTPDIQYTAAPTRSEAATPPFCTAQGGRGPEYLALDFFFADAAGNPVGVPYTYQLTIDLVADPNAISLPDAGATDAGPVKTSGGGNGCTVASAPSSPSTAFTLAFAVGAVALVRRRQRATGTRRGSASRSSSRSA